MTQKKATWTQLSKDLGFHVNAFREWRKLPGSPSEPDASEWKQFITENDLGTAGNRVSKGREHWLVEKLKKDVKLQDIRIEKEQRTLVPIDEVSEFVASMGFACRQWAYEIARELPRQIIGDNLAEAQAKSTTYADRMVSNLQGQVDGWWPETLEAPEITKDRDDT